MSPDVEMASAVVRKVVEMLGGRPAIPEPSDVASERDLIGAVLMGHPGAAEEAKRIPPTEFFDPFWQSIRLSMEAVEWRPERLTIPWLSKIMEAAELSDPVDVHDRLQEAVDCNPGVPRQSAKRIRLAARSRKLLAWVRRLEEDLALRRISADQAMERMRKATEQR